MTENNDGKFYKSKIKSAAKLATAFALIILTALFAFGSSLNNGFVYDDEYLIQPGRYMLSNIEPNVFFSDQYFGWFGEASYRPVVSLSYMIDYQYSGRLPVGYHQTNFLLHCGTALLIFILLRAIKINMPGALAGTLIFAGLPAASEAVNGIAFREDLLAALFSIAAIICLVRSIMTKHLRWIILFTPLMILALFSKESAFMLPVMGIAVMLLLKNPKDRPGKKFYLIWTITMSVVTGLCLLGWFLLMKDNAFFLPNKNPELNQRIFEIPCLFSFYFQKLFVPSRIAVELPMPENRKAALYVSILFLTGALIAGFMNKKAALFSLWFVIFLIPVLQIIPLKNKIGLRFVYLPAAAYAGWTALIFQRLWNDGNKIKRLAVVALIVIVTFQCGISRAVTESWENNLALWSVATKINADNARAAYNMGKYSVEAGFIKLGEKWLTNAVEIDPDSHFLLFQLGYFYETKQKNKKKAAEFYRKSLELKPDTFQPNFQLGRLLFLNNQVEKAEKYLKKAHALKPNWITVNVWLDYALDEIEKKKKESKNEN